MSCSLDNQSIKLLRKISRGGWATPSDLADNLPESEIEFRIDELIRLGVVKKFHVTPFLPALLGGVWGRYVIRLFPQNRNAEQLLKRNLPGLEESIYNSVLFTKRFPKITLFCFSRTKEELELLLRESGVEETPILARPYNFPFSAPVSDEERSLLREINTSGEIKPSPLAKSLGKDVEWIRAKLKRLILHSHNPQGIAILRATIRWHKINNFLHAHILLPSKAKDSLNELFIGLEWNLLEWMSADSETIAAEADFSGWGEFALWKEQAELAGFPPQGFALFVEELIYGKGFQF